MNTILKYLGAVVLSAAAAAVPVHAQTTPSRNLTLTQQEVADYAPQAGTLSVTAWVDHQDNRYSLGEPIQLFVMTNKDAYLNVIAVGPAGDVVQLFPNAVQLESSIKAGQILTIPGEGAPASIRATPPAGTELIKVIASTDPVTVASEDELEGQGVFRSVSGGSATVMRNLQVVIETPPAEIDTYDKVIWTVDATTAEVEPPAEPVMPADPETPAGPPVAPAAEVEASGPIIATDRDTYAIGDKVTMAVTVFDACNLWVVAVSDDQVNVLFPNHLVTANVLAASETAIISGGGSPVDVLAAGPAGPTVVYALCGKDARPPWGAGVDLTTAFPALDADDSLTRALVAVSPATAAPEYVAIPDSYTWTHAVIEVLPQN